jgi:hypothetical protein
MGVNLVYVVRIYEPKQIEKIKYEIQCIEEMRLGRISRQIYERMRFFSKKVAKIDKI